MTMPGVPDVYQGTELVDLSLVDPDNRRAVDYDVRRARLARLDAGAGPQDLHDEKLLVTSRALRVRRERPQAFVGEGCAYTPLATSTGSALAFARGTVRDEAAAGGGAQDGAEHEVVVVAARLEVARERHGGWGQHTVVLPDGAWRDALGGRGVRGGTTLLGDLLADLPVALLVRVDDGGREEV